jgi:hypothetical protein
MLILRRLFLVLLALGVSGLWAARTAQAALSQQALDWSARLLDLPAEWQTMEPRELLLNGARFGIVSGQSELPLPRLLDRLQASCRERSRLDVAPLAPRRDLPSLADGVLRVDNEHAGMVACLELGSEALAPSELLARLQTLQQTGDLASLGAIRLVRVEARGQGSFFVAVASDGPLPLPLLFPSRGDAPGVDPAGAPRPYAARRLLSVWQLGQEPSIHVYETSEGLEQAFRAYSARLHAQRFVPLTDTQEAADTRAALFKREGHLLLVTATRLDAGHTALVLSPLDSTGHHKSPPAAQPR